MVWFSSGCHEILDLEANLNVSLDLGVANLNVRVKFESTTGLQVELIYFPIIKVCPHDHGTSRKMILHDDCYTVTSIKLPLPPSGIWNLPDLYISRTEAKFSGFLSKKYSGGSPGTNQIRNTEFILLNFPPGMNSSHIFRISSMVLQDMSLPSLVLGNFRNVFLSA